MLYDVILTYDVTVSKCVKVAARSAAEALQRALDKAARGEAGGDHYSFLADSPDGHTVVRAS